MADAILTELRRLRLAGVDDRRDLSGVVEVGDWLFLANDEGRRIDVLARGDGEADWVWHASRSLGKPGVEADIEALAYADGQLYAIGSHALRRRAPDAEARGVAANRKRYRKIDREPARNRLYRMSFDAASGELGAPAHIDLSRRLRKDQLLAPFTRIPGKENGVDIEGLAIRDGRLYLGLRGPVLRDKLVPVLVLEFDRPKRYRVRLVRLDGQGIRDMVAVDDGFVLLAGPVNEAAGPFRLWHWDGRDQLPGSDRVVRPARRLATVGAPAGARAEGLCLLSENPAAWELLLLFDGVAGGELRVVRLARRGGGRAGAGRGSDRMPIDRASRIV